MPSRGGGLSGLIPRLRPRRGLRSPAGHRASVRQSRDVRLAGRRGSSDPKRVGMNADAVAPRHRPLTAWSRSSRTCRSPATPTGCGSATRPGEGHPSRAVRDDPSRVEGAETPCWDAPSPSTTCMPMPPASPSAWTWCTSSSGGARPRWPGAGLATGVSLWGPLGNGFGPPPAGLRPVRGRRHRPDAVPGPGPVVAGQQGVWSRPEEAGADPSWIQAAATFSSSATMLYGVRTAALLAGIDDFRRAGIEVEVATDDGSAGHHGFVTDLLARRLEQGERPSRIVGCGPPPCSRAWLDWRARHCVPCDVSLENHMACGFGACFSCVAPIRQPDGTTDLRRVCVEGPVFPADTVDWSPARH